MTLSAYYYPHMTKAQRLSFKRSGGNKAIPPVAVSTFDTGIGVI